MAIPLLIFCGMGHLMLSFLQNSLNFSETNLGPASNTIFSVMHIHQNYFAALQLGSLLIVFLLALLSEIFCGNL